MNISKAIRTVLKWWGRTPLEINNGECWLFSDEVIKLMGGETEDLFESFTESVSPGHVWITCNERHYDAEAPEGVDDPSLLPCCQRIAMEISRK